MLKRRDFLAGSAALTLTACGGATTSQSTRQSPGLPPDLLPHPNASWDRWVAGFRGKALSRGIDGAVYDRAFRAAGYLPGVVTRDRNQTEFKRSLEDYLSIAASDERIAKGRAAFARHRSTLNALEAQYGVDAEILCAIWGLESFFGERKGLIPVISATSTLAWEGRRARLFEAQLIDALKILQSGDIPASKMTGSWAGAMGHTQLMPSVYQAYAVDFTGDGRREIWGSDPSDALASTANYLKRFGWVRGRKWGAEDGPGAPAGRTLQPQRGGPVFRVTKNFTVIKRYNPSDAYAIGVGHLADRISGGGPLRGSFPPDKFGLLKRDRIALQQRLNRRGFDAGDADGIIGKKTIAAVEAAQRSLGLPVTGDPSLDLLRRL